MILAWDHAYSSATATGNAWGVAIRPQATGYRWSAECLGGFGDGDAETMDEAKAAATAWVWGRLGFPRWEYLVVETKGDDRLPQTILSSLGSQGWELISVIAVGRDYEFILKRPVTP